MEVAFITGGTGFVGSHLVAALCARGYAVRILALPDESTTALQGRNVTVYRGDVCVPETLVEPMRGAHIVFHLAGIHGLWRPRNVYYEVNVKGTENVCRAALAARTSRLVHVSTWAVYELGRGTPLNESQPLKPFSDNYTVTKAEADRLVQGFISREGLPAVIVRPGIMFGPGDVVNVARMADRLFAGRAIIIGSGSNPVVFVYVTDVVEGLILAATSRRALGGTYNLSNEEALTQEAFWRVIAEEIGSAPPRLHLPYRALYTLAYLSEMLVNPEKVRGQPLITRFGVELFGTGNRVSSEKARRELGYVPRVSLRNGLRVTAQWYLRQKHGRSGLLRPEAEGRTQALR